MADLRNLRESGAPVPHSEIWPCPPLLEVCHLTATNSSASTFIFRATKHPPWVRLLWQRSEELFLTTDYQNRAGANKSGAGVAGASESAVDRRERLRKLAMETIDLAKDPYILRTHLGTLECRLCLTLHVNEGSYLAHTQGKKHQTNLARRAARDQHEQLMLTAAPTTTQTVKKKVFVKIGRPGYKIVKIRDPLTQRLGLLFTIAYPEIKADERPRRRFMSAFEQKREVPNRAFQYLVIAAEPYETIAFAIPAKDMVEEEEDPDSVWEHWDNDDKVYSCQLLFK
ncbi:uncharacterized protein COLE_04160 [Cutaneotrichosporon oleaginosum]|uniref:uncharacterized protein n=1 Tax=Cutaneotrichosporon oleaginosum TaxID=879819 RepID=UPI00132A9AB1|nr:hypothetical protein COLE_04160 [Cutaneotrichosporon oleaginosum]